MAFLIKLMQFGMETERPQEALLCAKAKRQQQSAQSEWKSPPRYNDELKNGLH